MPQKWVVQAPDGKVIQFPDNFSATDVTREMSKMYPPAQTADASTIPENYGFTPSNMLSNAWEGAKSIVKGAYDLGKDVVTNPNWVKGDDSTLNKFVLQPAAAMKQKASTAKTPIESIGYSVAEALPIIGPWAASLGEQAGTGDVGGALAKGGTQVLAPKVTGAIAKPLLAAAGTRLYQSALKPSKAKYAPPAEQVVATGVREGIPVSTAGAEKLSDLLDETNQQIADKVASNPKATVNKFAVASRLGQTAKRFRNQVNPEGDLQAISDAGQEFLQNQPGQIPATDAQALKQGTYAQLKGKAYGELKGASIEAQKSLARGLKEELQNQFPELRDLNARDGSLIQLDGALQTALRRINNRDMVGIATPIAAAAGGALGGPLGAGGGAFLKSLLDNPTVKSNLAIALTRAGKMTKSAALQRIATVSGAIGTAEDQQPAQDATGDSSVTLSDPVKELQRELAKLNPDPRRLSDLYAQTPADFSPKQRVTWSKLGRAIWQGRHTEAATLVRRLKE